MTVPVQATYNVSNGNGVAVSFSCDFVVQLSGDLVVKVAGVTKTYPSDYTITNLGTTTNAIVVFATAPANGAQVVRERILPLSRTAYDYQQSGDFLAAVVNADLDRVWMAMQQLDTANDFALRFPVTAGTINTELPLLADGEGWIWDGDAEALVASPIGANAIAAAVVAADASADAASASQIAAAASALAADSSADAAAGDAAAVAAAIKNSRVIARKGGAVTIATGTTVTVVFDTEDYDPLSEYDNTTGVFTAANAGFYFVSAIISFDSGSGFSGSETADIQIICSGSSPDLYVYQTNSSVFTLQANGLFYLAQGETIHCAVHHNAAATRYTSTLNRLCISRLN